LHILHHEVISEESAIHGSTYTISVDAHAIVTVIVIFFHKCCSFITAKVPNAFHLKIGINTQFLLL